MSPLSDCCHGLWRLTLSVSSRRPASPVTLVSAGEEATTRAADAVDPLRPAPLLSRRKRPTGEPATALGERAGVTGERLFVVGESAIAVKLGETGAGSLLPRFAAAAAAAAAVEAASRSLTSSATGAAADARFSKRKVDFMAA